ncbi:MAG: DUF3365 domain-containing protein, partial [Bacteroidales bacterium]|nr:DUF3365 domain-containing protein [Bacteroidales bacterium]
AIPVTKEVENRTFRVVDLKRVTEKYRNPENKADSIEQRALDYFNDRIAANESLPGNYIQKIYRNDSVFYYYYKPLKVADICLTCHGDKSNIPAEILGKINTLYPGDNAVGYKSGDFRGLIKVSIVE